MPGIQQFDTTTRLLEKVLDLRAKNQEVIASNIANAETPGYAAQTFTFEEELQSALSTGGLRPVTSHPRHMPLASTGLDQVHGILETHRDTTGLGDENSVSMDQEMIRLSENELLYEAAVTMLNKKLSLLKYATSGGA